MNELNKITESDCNDPVSEKFGVNAFAEDFDGVWGFNKSGNEYGVTYQGEFLSLIKFDSEGNGVL